MPRLPKDYISYSGFLQRLASSVESNNEVLLILGSGASITSNIPTGSQLAQKWMQGIKNSYYPGSDMDQFTKELIDNTRDDSGVSPFDGLSNANQMEYYSQFYAEYHKRNPQDGYKEIERLIEKGKASFGYMYLAELIEMGVFKTVLTMNFDNLVERTLVQRTARVPRVISHESVAEVATYKSNVPTLIKLHRDAYFMPANTTEAISRASGVWKPYIKNVLKEKTIIVVGYSGLDDGVIVQALKELKKEGERLVIYWMIWESASPPKVIKDTIPGLNGQFCRFYGFDELMVDLVKEIGNYKSLETVHENQLQEQQSRNQDFIESFTNTLERALVARKNADEFYMTPESFVDELTVQDDELEDENEVLIVEKTEVEIEKAQEDQEASEVAVDRKAEAHSEDEIPIKSARKAQLEYSSYPSAVTGVTSYKQGIDWLSIQTSISTNQIHHVLKLAETSTQAEELFNKYFGGTDKLSPVNTSYNIWMHKQKSYAGAKAILERMQLEDVKTDVVTYTTLISKCRSAKDAREAFQLMQDDGVVPNVKAYSAYIDKLNFQDGFEAYEHMVDYWGIYPNEYTLNALLKNARTPENILKAIRALSEFDIGTNNVMLNLVVKAQKDFEEANAIFQDLVDGNNVVPDTLEYNTLISKMNKNNGYELNAVLQEMKDNSVPRDQLTAKYIIELGLDPQEVIQAIDQVRNRPDPKRYCDIIERMTSFENARMIYEFARGKNATNSYTISQLYKKAENKEHIKYVENEIESNTNLINVVVLNLRIKHTSKFEEALERFNAFKSYPKLTPDSYTFTALLSKASSGQQAYRVYQLMQEYGATPTDIHMMQMSRRSKSNPISSQLFRVLKGATPKLTRNEVVKMIRNSEDYSTGKYIGEMHLETIKDPGTRNNHFIKICEALLNKVKSKSDLISLLKYNGENGFLKDTTLSHRAKLVITDFDKDFLKEVCTIPKKKLAGVIIKLFPYNVLIEAIEDPNLLSRIRPLLRSTLSALIHHVDAVNDVELIRDRIDLIKAPWERILVKAYFELYLGNPKEAIKLFHNNMKQESDKGTLKDEKLEKNRLKNMANAHVKMALANLRIKDTDRATEHVNEAFKLSPSSENDQYPVIVAVYMASYYNSKSQEEIIAMVEANYNFIVGAGRMEKAKALLERFWEPIEV